MTERKPREPMSTHAILMRAGGLIRPAGFRIRQRFDADVEDALKALHANAVAMFGEEHAACVLAHILAKASPTNTRRTRVNGASGAYRPRPWAVEILRKHRVAIAEAFAREPRPDVETEGTTLFVRNTARNQAKRG